MRCLLYNINNVKLLLLCYFIEPLISRDVNVYNDFEIIIVIQFEHNKMYFI